MSCLDPRRHVVRTLAGSKFNDANVGEPSHVERILARDRFNLLAARADGHDDSAVSRNFSARHQKMSGRVVLLQKLHVRGHRLVDGRERSLVDQFDDEHQNNQAPRAMNVATNTMATTSTISAVLIRRYASTENCGNGAPRLRAARTRMNVVIGASSSRNTSPNKASFSQKNPLRQ